MSRCCPTFCGLGAPFCGAPVWLNMPKSASAKMIRKSYCGDCWRCKLDITSPSSATFAQRSHKVFSSSSCSSRILLYTFHSVASWQERTALPHNHWINGGPCCFPQGVESNLLPWKRLQLRACTCIA